MMQDSNSDLEVTCEIEMFLGQTVNWNSQVLL